MPRRKSLAVLTERLGKRYDKWKHYEGKKDSDRIEFFKAATLAEQNKALATKTVALSPALPEDEARAYLAKYHPRWVVKDLKFGESLVVRALLEEDPQFTSFVYVNPRDRRVYTRQVNDGGPVLDDELLEAQDPELYSKVTFTSPWGESILWPLDKLPDDLLAKLQSYIYPGKTKVVFAAPRKAKADEPSSE